MRSVAIGLAILMPMTLLVTHVHAQGRWEQTPQSRKAVEDGLKWLADHQGPAGNWGSDNLGLVAMGALAFMAAGHTPDKGPYGHVVRRALDYITVNAKPSGLLNIATPKWDMYNHGLATFVLTQAYGMTNDPKLGKQLDAALKLICSVQADDGGWDYFAQQKPRGHDLSLVVMQAKALRGAADVGLHIPPQTIDRAIVAVQRYYKPMGKPDGKAAQYHGADNPLADRPGQFTYNGNKGTLAMAAAGAVCLQEFGRYEDFRIYRSMDEITKQVDKLKRTKHRPDQLPFDPYTMYYVGQAIYQVGGQSWKSNYPILRDAIVATQHPQDQSDKAGSWASKRWVSGDQGRLFATAVGVLVLSIPNRYLPIFQEGRITKDTAPVDSKTTDEPS